MSAHRIDAYVENLWNFVQSNPRYRDQTTLIYSPDHGRGHGPAGWKSHSDKFPGSENIWIAVIGPDTPPLGERTGTTPIRQNQIAATLARFLGEDYCAVVPKAGKPIADVFPTKREIADCLRLLARLGVERALLDDRVDAPVAVDHLRHAEIAGDGHQRNGFVLAELPRRHQEVTHLAESVPHGEVDGRFAVNFALGFRAQLLRGNSRS